jgi:hypothetical protein
LVVAVALGGGGVGAWLASAFFGVGALFALALVVRPGQLTIDEDGMTLEQLWRRTRFDFDDCSDFRTGSIPVSGQRIVSFDWTKARAPRLGRFNQRVSGGNSALPDTFGLTATELAHLLNGRRGLR